MKASILLPALALVAGPARAELISCPDQLAVEERVVQMPDGWQSFQNQAEHPLAGVSLFEGLPSEQATLVPDSSRKQGKRIITSRITSWNLPTSREGYWLACLYGGTGMVVARKLPDGVKSCRVESDATTDPPSPVRIECR
ncbi:STY0301 family protein [Aliidongia dinghuensis]|nr:STY0301 family protein [Aliidongia dinghuensis]